MQVKRKDVESHIGEKAGAHILMMEKFHSQAQELASKLQQEKEVHYMQLPSSSLSISNIASYFELNRPIPNLYSN